MPASLLHRTPDPPPWIPPRCRPSRTLPCSPRDPLLLLPRPRLFLPTREPARPGGLGKPRDSELSGEARRSRPRSSAPAVRRGIAVYRSKGADQNQTSHQNRRQKPREDASAAAATVVPGRRQPCDGRKGGLQHREQGGLRREALEEQFRLTIVQKDCSLVDLSSPSPSSETSPLALHSFTASLVTLARRQSRRIFCFVLTAPSLRRRRRQKMAVFNWLDNLGRIYGVSLMVLVGLGYWIQGFRCFPWFAVNFYFKDVLTVDPGTLQIVQNTVNLPMVAKPVYGIVSDAVYIGGAHRVPYLVIGGSLQVLSWGMIALFPGGGSSVLMIAILLAMSNLGASMVDVANDALVAECAKKKKSTGELQSFAWFSTAAGGVLGNLIAAFALSRMDFKVMFGVFGLLVSFQVLKSLGVNEGSFGLRMPHSINADVEKRMELAKVAKKRPKLLPSLATGSADASFTVEDGWMQHSSANLLRGEDEELSKAPGTRQQFADLIHLVRQPEILYPLSWFMASYAMIPTLAGTMFFFQTQHLKVDPSIVGLAKVIGQVALMGGSAFYSRYLKGMPLRKLLASIQILLCFSMLFDIFLVKRLNVELGIPDALLVLGGSAFVDALNQFKILPFMVFLAQLCPAGSEGSLLAAFMSVQCLATIISGYMGVTLASLLHISPSDFSELPTGIFLQAMAALLPLVWISFIPDGSKVATLQSRDGKST